MSVPNFVFLDVPHRLSCFSHWKSQASPNVKLVCTSRTGKNFNDTLYVLLLSKIEHTHNFFLASSKDKVDVMISRNIGVLTCDFRLVTPHS